MHISVKKCCIWVYGTRSLCHLQKVYCIWVSYVGSWIWCRHWIAISQTVFKDPDFIIRSMTFDVSEQCNHFYLLQFLQWGSYQICKIAGCACAGNAANVFATRPLQMKSLISDPDMHHDTCVTHMPWCMSGSLTCGGGENVPGIPGACAPAILRIWHEPMELQCVSEHNCPVVKTYMNTHINAC